MVCGEASSFQGAFSFSGDSGLEEKLEKWKSLSLLFLHTFSPQEVVRQLA